MKILGVIPSRYASSRLPGKPLKDIGGAPMITRVYQQAKKCEGLIDVVVATDDSRIYAAIESAGGKAMMTSEAHQNGTERCAEVMEKYDGDVDYVVNIQGDEPFINPQEIEDLIKILDGNTQLGTLIKRIDNPEDLWKDSIMKVVFNVRMEALYFSRNCIPFVREKPKEDWLEVYPYHKHIGIYAYRRDILNQVVNLPMSTLEKTESLEQLRWLENGYTIKLVETEYESMSVDTPEDLEKARSLVVQ